MLLTIVHQLMPNVPPEQFTAAIKWSCYLLGHSAVELNKKGGHFSREKVTLVKQPEMADNPDGTPCRPGEILRRFLR
jgi:hypothetical protein